MTDARRIAAIACFMLVTLRLMIGWQLLYEGFWKVKTLKSPTPWTAAGYLKNSQGPFRDMFRKMAGDPDDLSWITAVPIPGQNPKAKSFNYWVPGVERRWDAWQRKFDRHYKLDAKQKSMLNRWVNGAKTIEVELPELPSTVDFEAAKLDKYVSYNSEKKRLVVDGTRHLLPDQRAKLTKAIDSDVDGIPNSVDFDLTKESGAADADEDGIDDSADVDVTGGTDANSDGIDDASEAAKEVAYLIALEKVYKKSKDGLSFKEKLRATVAGNPDWMDDEEAQKVGEITKYKGMLAAYENSLKNANQAYNWDHLQHSWSEVQAQRAMLVNPVKALDKELTDKANSLLTVDQLKKGPPPTTWTALKISDMLTIAGLTILGAMLILGLCTRFAAVMAAVMLFMFYAAMPPWPNVPEAPGPEHSFIVNKNFIEVIALLAIATLPTGRWFGVDGMLGRWLGKRRQQRKDKNFESKWEGEPAKES